MMEGYYVESFNVRPAKNGYVLDVHYKPLEQTVASWRGDGDRRGSLWL